MKNFNWSKYSKPIILVAFIVVLSILRPKAFLSLDNFSNVLWSVAVIGIMVSGSIFVFLIGGIDLSIATLCAFSAVVVVSVTHMLGDTPGAVFAGVLAAPVLGHAFSPMLRNHGGKAIAVTFGTYIGLCPHSILLFLLAVPFVFFSTVLRITPHSLRVMTTYAVTLGSSVFLEKKTSLILGAVMITAAVIYRHIGDYIRREKRCYGLYVFSFRLLGREPEQQEISRTGKA